MGFLDNAFQKLEIEAEKALEEHKKKDSSNNSSATVTSGVPSQVDYERTESTTSTITLTMSEVMHYGSNATRWEKTVVATDSVVGQVANFDPDGVEIVCVGGDESLKTYDEIEWHEGIQDTKGLEDTITKREPGGSCPLGKAVEEVLTKALEKDLTERPCSVLVLTAGKPDDSAILEEALRKASQLVADNGGVEKCPLSVTFIQIGNDQEASDYLTYLDKKMVGITEGTGEKVDIVDTMGFEELKETVESMRGQITKAKKKKKQHGKNGAILGAVTGVAMGVGGMYLKGKSKTKKRVKSGSWEGKWNCFYEDEKVATLTVEDDKKGNLTIEGLESTMQGNYIHDETANGAMIDSEEFFIRFAKPDGEVVEGAFDSENFVLNWNDGTRWEAVNKIGWAKYLGAATAGAALVGATGYFINKKFFKKVGEEEACDYVLVLDRSAKMAITDSKV